MIVQSLRIWQLKHCHDKLVTALSNDLLSISGILLANEFISEEVHSKMLLPTATPEEKATDLVNALRRKIKLVPDQFQKLIRIFSEQACTSDNLAKYQLHYQKKSELETSEWQKLELTSLECRTCLPDLSDGCMYVVKICAVSDVGTLQYSNESDPIIISAEGTLTNNIHKVIVAKNDGLTSPFPSADPNTFAALLSTKGVISKEDETQISLASTPRKKATLLIIAMKRQTAIFWWRPSNHHSTWCQVL